jgi:thiamine biosynthesis protein ThiS
MKKVKKIKINLNGMPLFLPKGTSVYKVIKKNNLYLNKIAIELNKEIINKKKIKKILLKNKDKIEIVHFIGGG